MKRIVIVIAVGVMTVALNAQGQPKTRDKSREWTVPRTSDGHPDLQGIWTTQTYTPLQRPKRYAGRAFLSDEEFAALTALVTQPGVDPLAPDVLGADDDDRVERVRQNDPTHYDNSLWLSTAQPKALSSRRTSLIVDPADGRIPPLTAEAQARAAARRASISFDSYENRPLQERCVVWAHEGPPMIPPPYNDLYEILQTGTYFVVRREVQTNLPRLIPTDGRPHISESIRQYGGDSRGHWDGDTLVVETTNFSDKNPFMGSTAALRVTERFTRVSADTIRYEFTVDDPATWLRPWSAEIPMMKTDGPLLEYACHEGNYGASNILKGARNAERAATGAKR
jgi:hypothetical protein